MKLPIGTIAILVVIAFLAILAEWNDRSCASISPKPLRCSGFLIPDDEIHPARKSELIDLIAEVKTARER